MPAKIMARFQPQFELVMVYAGLAVSDLVLARWVYLALQGR